MDKFWEWMKEKGYSENNYPSWLHCGNTEYQPNKQMLIGYMMEYLDEIYKWNGKWMFEKLVSSNARSTFISMLTTEGKYDWLNKKINELEAKRG